MTYIDTHCHINDDSLFPHRKEIIEEAMKEGVNLFIVPGWNLESSRKAVMITHEFPNVYAAVGIHPENIEEEKESSLLEIKELAKDKKVVAIGEIGLDYHWNKEKMNHDLQKEWFIKQIALANELSLPVSIHSRDASEETLLLLKEHPLIHHAVLHCYSGSSELLHEFTKLGLYFGFDGPITYKNAVVPKENVILCPLDRILSETDSPYLSPVPYRGKENHPAYVKEIVNQIAFLKQLSVEEITEAIRDNVASLFHVEPKQ